MNKEGLIAPEARFNFVVEQHFDKTRIDRYLTGQFPLYSRSFFKKVIEEGFVSINQHAIAKPSVLVRVDDTIVVQFPPKRSIAPHVIKERNFDVEIVHEEDHFFVIHKPAGLVVHPPHTNSTAVTLVDWLLLYYKELGGVGYVDRPGIVHRLDRDTSGLMIIPRTNGAHGVFSEQFKKRTIKKTYLAVVRGHPEPVGTITYPIGRHQSVKTKMYAYADDNHLLKTNIRTRSATTHYKVLEYFEDSSLVEVSPISGRTHQIRVHFASLGHALVGDEVYGIKSKKIKRHALHAQRLRFVFMGRAYDIYKEMPTDLQKLIQHERNNKTYTVADMQKAEM